MRNPYPSITRHTSGKRVLLRNFLATLVFLALAFYVPRTEAGTLTVAVVNKSSRPVRFFGNINSDYYGAPNGWWDSGRVDPNGEGHPVSIAGFSWLTGDFEWWTDGHGIDVYDDTGGVLGAKIANSGELDVFADIVNGANQVVLYEFDGVGPDTYRPQIDNPEVPVNCPIDALNGNEMLDVTDIAIPAPGLPLVFGRSYNSMEPDQSIEPNGSVQTGGMEFGRGWRASTDWAMFVPNGWYSLVTLRTGEGRLLTFLPVSETAGWICDMDERLRLRSSSGGWRLDGIDNGASMQFDSQGRWAWTDDGWGNRITAYRDAGGHTTNLSHTCGACLNIVWSNNHVTAVSGPNNILSVEYDYNSDGFLTGVVRRAQSGETIGCSYGYDPVALCLTKKVDALGVSLNYSYQDGRCVNNYFGDGSMPAYVDKNDDFVTVTRPLVGFQSRQKTIYPLVNGLRIATLVKGDQNINYLYDLSRYSVTGMVWQTSNNCASRLTQTDSLGRPIGQTTSFNSQTGSTWTTVWDSILDLPTTQTDPLGWRTQYTWTNGVPSSIQETNGYGGWLTTSLIYSQGLLTAVSNPLSRTNFYQYDSRGVLAGVTPPAGPAIAFSNDALGNMVSAQLPGQDGTPRLLTCLRDGFGNITNAIAPDGISVLGYYDAIGNLTGIVDRAGRQIAITYGVASRPLSINRIVTDNGVNRVVTLATSRDLQMDPTVIIDPLGRAVESYVRDSAGRVSTTTNVEGKTATVQYGPADLPLSVSRFDGTTNTIAYNGDWNPVSSIFPGRTNTFAWLPNGLLASAANEQAMVTNTWIAPGWLTSQTTTTSNWTGQVNYAGDLSGAITQVTATAIGLSSIRKFDGGGRETNRTFSCNGAQLASARQYGSWNGLPVSVNTGPIQQTLGWDNLDRLTNLTWQAQGQPVQGICFFYDVLGQITQRVDTVAGVQNIRSYVYDGLDRLASETHGNGFSASYSFDDAGHRSTKTTANFGLSYTGGIGDRLANWTATQTTPTTFTVSGCANMPIGTNGPNGIWPVYNSVSSATPTINGSNFTATLTQEPLGTQTVFALIANTAGNLSIASNQFVWTAYTTGNYSSSPAGCVTQIVYQGPLCLQSKALSWDAEYRLTSVATNGTTAESYVYDPTGRRISTTATDGTVTRYLNDGQHVLADLNATGGILRTYFYGPNVDELLAITVYTNATPQTYFTIRDHQNTVWALVDTNGVMVETYDFDAWGRVLSVTDGNGNVLASSAIGNRYLFQGREYSWATGLYYFRARWYDPVTGRWLSPDPIGINGGLNQYVFCANNPVNFIDPLGMATADYDFVDPKSFTWGERMMQPRNIVYVKTAQDIINDLQTRAKNGESISGITISNHGGGSGSANFGDINFLLGLDNAADSSSDCGKKHRSDKYAKDAIAARNFFNQLGSFMADDGELTLVMCGAGAGDSGKGMQKRLSELLGGNRSVTAFPGGCGYFFGVPMPAPFWAPNKKQIP
jgi:RHS repeat-associated protein